MPIRLNFNFALAQYGQEQWKVWNKNDTSIDWKVKDSAAVVVGWQHRLPLGS